MKPFDLDAALRGEPIITNPPLGAVAYPVIKFEKLPKQEEQLYEIDVLLSSHPYYSTHTYSVNSEGKPPGKIGASIAMYEAGDLVSGVPSDGENSSRVNFLNFMIRITEIQSKNSRIPYEL